MIIFAKKENVIEANNRIIFNLFNKWLLNYILKIDLFEYNYHIY